MIGYFVFSGKCSRDYGLYISGGETFNAPERDVEVIEIPGRNGNLIKDNGRFKNISVTYPAFVRMKFKEHASEARGWLLKESGYKRLEDSYNTDFYRMARFSGPLDFNTRVLNRSGECNISFDCKPQRFLKIGDYPVAFFQAGQLYNPTFYPALPLFRVYGTDGNLLIGNTVIQISMIDEYLDIDSDTQNAYKGTINCNEQIYAPEFPMLKEGQTGISFEGNITKVEVIPRWWTV